MNKLEQGRQLLETYEAQKNELTSQIVLDILEISLMDRREKRTKRKTIVLEIEKIGLNFEAFFTELENLFSEDAQRLKELKTYCQEQNTKLKTTFLKMLARAYKS